MTHKDIYTKFMIEYDKANVTSSYPSLTKYEVATVLDKAYNALIAQKVTGNNPRRAPFEADVKSVSDLEQLITRVNIPFETSSDTMAINTSKFQLPLDFMYYVQLLLQYNTNKTQPDHVSEDMALTPDSSQFHDTDENEDINVSEVYYGTDNNNYIQPQDIYTGLGIGDIVNDDQTTTPGSPYDNLQIRVVPVKLVSHEIAEKFMSTSYNIPWVKNPVCYVYNNAIEVVYDPIDKPMVQNGNGVYFVYIHKPKSFVLDSTGEYDFSEETSFELSETMAEELINLAVAFALENVESQRLNSKLNMRGLEA